MLELYSYIRAQLSQNNINYRDINTFRVFPPSVNLDTTTPNLSATVFDKESPFFFSKLWKENRFTANDITWMFPLLFCLELGARVTPTALKSFKINYALQIGCLVALPETPGRSASEYTQPESINDAFYRTQQLIMPVLGDINNNFEINPLSIRLFRIEMPAIKVVGTGIEAEIIANECYD
jgi:hypothetical protein